MHSAPLGHPTTIGALQAGGCFAIDWHGRTLIGIKIVDDFAAHPIASCAVLWPGLPELGNRPGFLDETFAPATGVFALDETTIVPTSDLAFWRVGSDVGAEAGTVIHVRERLMLGVARRNGKVACIDLAAGKTVMLPENLPLLHVGSWRLMHKAPGGWETLFDYRCSSAKSPAQRIGEQPVTAGSA
jgi:hypothetical protein